MKKLIVRFSLCFLSLLALSAGCKKGGGDETGPPDEPINYEASASLFANPERGFIKTYIVKSGGVGLTTAQLNLLRPQNISLLLRLFYFDAYKDRALDNAMLTLIREDMTRIRTAGLKVILRFGYTDDISGTDAPLAIVEQHIEQLKPVFEENVDIIAFVQAGFIGAWGEWHSSSNGLATVANQRVVLNKLLSVLPVELMVQVRTPSQKQQVLSTTTAVNSSEAYTSEAKARVGHHNDCFLSSATDYGTYTNATIEKQYISSEALYVPTGGETCPPAGGFDPSCATSRNEMKLLKWTYLNLDWYPGTISAWKNSGCFDEFQSNLGYRLALVEGRFPDKINTGGSLQAEFSIINRGYAPLYHKKNMVLVLKNKTSGAFHDIAMQADLRTCKPGATLNINESVSLAGLPAGSYELYLRIADRSASLAARPEYAIRLANREGWVEEHGGMNTLKHDLIIQ